MASGPWSKARTASKVGAVLASQQHQAASTSLQGARGQVEQPHVLAVGAGHAGLGERIVRLAEGERREQVVAVAVLGEGAACARDQLDMVVVDPTRRWPTRRGMVSRWAVPR
jgi:hypothetical protein